MNKSRILELMLEAIDEARKSRSEDGRDDHPYVGAILANLTGEIILRSHRGEASDAAGLPLGVHAEYVLLKKAKQEGIDLSKTALFVTLEPCTKRGPDKVPCAMRVAASGIPLVYIGDLDPNPDITGLGETYVSLHTTVERFPSHLVKELRKLNEKCWDRYSHEIIWTVSMYAAPSARDGDDAFARPTIARQREPLLHQSLDLICRSKGQIWISAGDFSWLRELHIGLLRAAMENRSVRVLSAPRPGKKPSKDLISAMVHVGADLVELGDYWPMRATIAAPLTDGASMLFLEDEHAALYQMPRDGRLLNTIAMAYDKYWAAGTQTSGVTPSVKELTGEELIDALRTGVPLYATLKIEPCQVQLEDLLLLPKSIERFKLYRLNQLHVLRLSHGLPDSFVIEGYPWPTTPPVFERLSDGRTVVIDGAHRAYAARSRGESTISGLLVHNPRFDVPSTPMSSWDDIRLSSTKLPRDERYLDYVSERFRPIRQAFCALAGIQGNRS